MTRSETDTAPPEVPETSTQGAQNADSRTYFALVRNTWRGLTSMRTALVLLSLLGVAALPGALLPQRSLNAARTDQYLAAHPTIGPWLDRMGFFAVFASPWFAAIYLLLFVSLIGCLTPRALEYARACRARPVAVPRNLNRLPHHASGEVDGTPDEVVAAVRARLKGWRLEVRGHTISAEKGYLREAGNLVFHLALVGLLVGFAAGKLFGYEGQVIVLTQGGQFCNSGILNYDSFRAGTLVDGTSLSPFCVRADDFRATYQPDGQATSFHADIAYQAGEDLAAGPAGPWRPYGLEVNHPLRVAGDRVYLLGNGYAPRFTVTYPDGTKRTQAIQWRTMDPTTLLAEGATKFDPPNAADPQQWRNKQIAVTGLFAPTSSGGKVVTSVFPALLRPEVAVDVMRGDLGLDDGRGQSIFEVDQRQVDSAALKRVARANMTPGTELTLDDGTRVRFDDVVQWVSLQVSHDPAQEAVLVFAVLVLGGLATSLTIKRRRFWARATPDDSGRTVLELGGLARTDQAGYGEEFHRLRDDLLPGRSESS